MIGKTVRVPALLCAGLLVACAKQGDGDDGALGGGARKPGPSVYLNVVPPGQNGNSAGGGAQGQGPYPANFRDQLDLYGNLAYATQGLKAAPCTPPASLDDHAAASDLACNYFKEARLTPPADATCITPSGLPEGMEATICRDGWGVPYVQAKDRASAMFGVGYVSAQDRLFQHDVLRNIGRGRLSEFFGPAAGFYDFDESLARVAGYSEDELQAMLEGAHSKFGTLGDLIIADVDSLTQGINAYIAFLQTPEGAGEVPPEYESLAPGQFPPRDWNARDIVASAILIQSIFAVGGGSEHNALLLLQKLDPSFGPGDAQIPQAACEFWRDVRHANDPDTPYTIEASFPTQSPATVSETCPQTLPAGAAVWDVDSFAALDPFEHSAMLPLAKAAPAKARTRLARAGRPTPAQRRAVAQALEPFVMLRKALHVPQTASNFIAVNADRTTDGYPIAVMGPQTSYFLPQLLWEVAVVSNGGTPLDFAGRGIVFADLPYINIGRGIDYAWSATSGSSDIIDIRVSRLCNIEGSALDGGALLNNPPSRNDARNNNTGAGGADGYPDADGYLYSTDNGATFQCRRFYRRTDAWTAAPTPASLASNGPLSPESVTRRVLRTHYGPVIATALVGGQPVAVSLERSTFFGELETAPPFALASTRLVKDPQSFRRVFNSVTGTFNWLYVDRDNVGYIHSGLYPKRHPQGHAELPVWGDGRFEWENGRDLDNAFFATYGGFDDEDSSDGNDDGPIKGYPNRARPVAQGDPLNGYFEWAGYLTLAEHPQATNPAKGYIHSWNNAPARDWWAADFNGSYGPTHRADMLAKRLAAFADTGRKHDIGTMTEIMADAAFTDLRGQEVLPLLLEVLRTQAASPGLSEIPDLAALNQLVALMQDWLDDGSAAWIEGDAAKGLGAYRRDRDRSGTYDHRAAVVLMDAWYPRLIDRILPQLDGDTPNIRGLVGQGSYDAPREQGSAYQFGWFQNMKRVLEMALDKPGHTPYRRLKCAGTGGLAACRAAVLEALNQAVADAGGLANIDDWDGSGFGATFAGQEGRPNQAAGEDSAAVEAYSDVEHTAISTQAVPSIHWTNRPTFQQAIQVKKTRSEE